MTKQDDMVPDDFYQIPEGARIGHIHLKVSDLERSVAFYCGLLGFRITKRYGEEAVFIAAGGYHHHMGLNVWYSKNAEPAPRHSVGLFHTAIAYPDRKDLAVVCNRLLQSAYPLTGSADHGVSEALYLDDPDGNGVELYWDRPASSWPRQEDGAPEMYTRPLSLESLLALIQ